MQMLNVSLFLLSYSEAVQLHSDTKISMIVTEQNSSVWLPLSWGEQTASTEQILPLSVLHRCLILLFLHSESDQSRDELTFPPQASLVSDKWAELLIERSAGAARAATILRENNSSPHWRAICCPLNVHHFLSHLVSLEQTRGSEKKEEMYAKPDLSKSKYCLVITAEAAILVLLIVSQ